MCGAEPLVSKTSAESVDEFYTLLEERKRFAASRSITTTPKWPAARNDHYCDQEVCRHDVIDLSSLCEPSDSDSDWEPYITGVKKFPIIGYESPSNSEQSITESCRQYFSDDADYIVRLRYNTPPTVYDDQDHGSRRMSAIDPKSSIRALRQELDNLQISSAQSFLDLEEQLDVLSSSYGSLRMDYQALSDKHNELLGLSLKQSRELGNQAKVLMGLSEWKMRIQNSFAAVRVQGQEPEVLYFDTPRSTSTAEIGLEDPKDTPLATESHDATSTSDRRDSGVGGIPPPPIMPPTTPERRVTHPRLVLRLPAKPEMEDEVLETPGALATDMPVRPKRVRRPTEKRKAAELETNSARKARKLSCKSAPF
ncbi:uncharacterized protein J4E88_000960 [Alternaria novae-zelandiae]|uniref:uncharacterized protein n=1 Tax=Alternaria novae-zelandiae TaxID=430562 RepID=UPI0020C1D8FB|nr:uncharacterized protein J4E88_000960 [Alternaria novae-zelandiae]KAI4696782.1 hypothetical protein J4E88_000960 [Alternaria novae-zelandiae]